MCLLEGFEGLTDLFRGNFIISLHYVFGFYCFDQALLSDNINQIFIQDYLSVQ